MYDAIKIKTASEAEAARLLREPENAALRGTVLGALGKLTAARDEAQLETLYGMAQGMKNNFEDKGNDAGALAIGIAMTAIETGYHAATGKTLDDAARFAEKNDEPQNAVGIFSTKMMQNPSGGFVATPPTPTVAAQPKGAMTISDVSKSWPSRIQPEIRALFESIKPVADTTPGILHTLTHTCPRSDKTLTIEGGKFRTSNALNMDGIQKQNLGKTTYFVSAECYEQAIKPYLGQLVTTPRAEIEPASHLTPRGAYSREAFRSFHHCLNNVPPPVMQDLREDVIAQMKQQASAGIAPNDDGSRTVRLDGKPLRIIATPHGEALAVLVKVTDISDLQALVKQRSSAFRCGHANESYSDTVRRNAETGYGINR